MIYQSSIPKSSFSASFPIHKHPSFSSPDLAFPFSIRCQSSDAKSKIPTDPTMGPFTRRHPNVKKPPWLRQKAPQGERFQEVKDSLSRLNLNTVSQEAQCPNIGKFQLPTK